MDIIRKIRENSMVIWADGNIYLTMTLFNDFNEFCRLLKPIPDFFPLKYDKIYIIK